MKKFIIDSFFSIFSSILLVVALQFIALPIISKDISIQLFGYILIVLAVRNIVVQIFGGTLNNIRLLNQERYKKREYDKIFNGLLLVSVILGILSSLSFLTLFLDGYIHTFVIITIILAIINSYFMVIFRIKLLYKKIFFSQSVMAVGYIIGLCIYLLSNEWTIVILLPEIFLLIYLLNYLKRIKYDFNIEWKNSTFSWNSFISDYTPLAFSNIINNGVSYLDRIIFNPLLGSTAVTQYYVATLTPKTISIGVTPINGVILSYISKFQKRIKVNTFHIIILILLCLFILINGILYFISPVVIKYLYSDYFDLVKPYILLGNLSITLGIITNMLNPIVLKVAGTSSQFKVSLAYGLFYIFTGVYSTYTYGIFGFFVSSLIANVFKFFLLFIIAYKKIRI